MRLSALNLGQSWANWDALVIPLTRGAVSGQAVKTQFFLGTQYGDAATEQKRGLEMEKARMYSKPFQTAYLGPNESLLLKSLGTPFCFPGN